MAAFLGATALLGLTGCGSLHRKADFTRTGSADPRGDKKVQERFAEEQGQSFPDEAEGVTVLIDTLPEGVSLSDGVLTIDSGYQHEIIGKFEITADMGFFPPYREGWRNGFCHPQQILVVGTLFIWTLVPTYYPCFTTNLIEKADMVDQLKIAGYSAGGDLVIATYVHETSDDAANAVGFVLRMDPRLTDGGGGVEKEDPNDDGAEAEGENASGNDAAPDGAKGDLKGSEVK